MRTRSKFCGAFGALALCGGSHSADHHGVAGGEPRRRRLRLHYFWNTATNQCQFCDTAVMYWNYELNQCFPIDPTPYVGPVVGPARPVGVGRIRSSDRSGRSGWSGVGPVAGPVGPVGVGRR